MTTKKATTSALALAVVSGVLQAQTVELDAAYRDFLRSLIHAEGHRCDSVPTVRIGGKTESGDVYVIAACTGGDEHALRLPRGADRPVYYMACRSIINPVC